MSKYKVAIATSSFAKADSYPLELLKEAGVEVKDNPYGRKMTEQEIIDHLQGVHGLLAGLEPLNRFVLEAAKDLQAIARVGIGMDNVDQDAARQLGIAVSNTPDGPTESVAELCLSVLLALGRNLVQFNADMHAGTWKKQMGFGLQGLKVLLIGYGRIGKRFAEMLKFFGAKILIYDCVSIDSTACLGQEVSLEQGLKEVDVISLHASGKEQILGEREFEIMCSGVVLLNCARGELVNEQELIKALESGKVSAAWLDVFQQEPYQGRLQEFDNVLLTPHVSTYSRQCRRNMEEKAVRNLISDLGLAISKGSL